MRRYVTLSAAAAPFLLMAQVPLWEWAVPLSGISEVQCDQVQAIDGGCFVHATGSGSFILPNDTLFASSALFFVDSSSNIRMGVAMSRPRHVQDLGNGGIAFASSIEGSFRVGDLMIPSDAGIGLVSGQVDTTGTFSNVVQAPDLIIGYADHRVIALHHGPSGNVHVLGVFRDSIAIADTVLIGSGTFVARFSSTLDLIRADRYDIQPHLLENVGAIVEDVDGTVFMAIVQSADEPTGILGDGLLLLGLNPEGNIVGSHANGNGSFYADEHPCLAAHPLGGVYLAYGMYAGSDGPPIKVMRFDPACAVIWENTMAAPLNAWGAAEPFQLEATATNGVLVSGYSTVPLNMPGLGYMSNGPRGVVYKLSADNEFRWAIANNTGNVFGARASMNNAGEVYAAGWLERPAAFGPHEFPSAQPYTTGYVARIGQGFVGIAETATGPLLPYPNPAQDLLHLSIPLPGNVQIFDLLGRDHTAAVLVKDPNTLDVSRLPPGAYVIQLGMARTVFIKA